MYRQVFIDSFSRLGKHLQNYLNGAETSVLLTRAIEETSIINPLSTVIMQRHSLNAIASEFLERDKLENWTAAYADKITEKYSSVGIIMAGNLPLVGFHDMLAALASGSIAAVKTSSKDPFLIRALVNILSDINDYWKRRIHFVDDPPDGVDILIATGSDSTAEYFNKQYGSTPKIIRGSRFSFAVLNGNEVEDDFRKLADDIFLYYGMGCRSVSTLFIPEGYDIADLALRLCKYAKLSDNKYYIDSYRYQKALAHLSGENYADGGSFIIRIGLRPPPPLSVISVFIYSNRGIIRQFIKDNQNSVQCSVNYSETDEGISFGEAQFPRIDDYADGVNSLEFILKNI